MEEGTKKGGGGGGRYAAHSPQDDENNTQISLAEFRKPRNSLLVIVAHFFNHATNRVREIRRILGDPSVRLPELLDTKSHIVSYILYLYLLQSFLIVIHLAFLFCSF